MQTCDQSAWREHPDSHQAPCFLFDRGLIRNCFRCATRYFDRGVDDLIKLNFPSTHAFSEKLFLKKDSSLGNKSFAFGWMVEGVPNGLPWISYKDAFFLT
jgi:hypothetical protein